MIDQIRKRLSYCESTGALSWRDSEDMPKKWRTRYANKKISCVGSHGYVCFNITINGTKHHLLAHRVIWAMKNNRWPKEIDHIDRNKTNNVYSNLRECTSAQNKINIPARSNNKLKTKGVVFLGEKINGEKRYAAFCSKAGKTYYVGTYPTKEQASAAYKQTTKEIHGTDAR